MVVAVEQVAGKGDNLLLNLSHSSNTLCTLPLGTEFSVST